MTARFAYGVDTIEIIDSVPEDHSQQAIRQLDLNIPFQAYRRKFFMLDLFPELEAEISGVKL